jgi:CDP-glycerol glycerophosphotransferase
MISKKAEEVKMNNLITGKYFSVFINRIFSFIKLLIRSVLVALMLFFTVVNKILTRYLFTRIDLLLSRLAKKRLVSKTAVDKDTILMTTLQGEYTCNVKYISEELIKRDLPYNIVWAVKGTSLGPYPSEVSFVKEGSINYFMAAAKAKVIIQNGHGLQKNGVVKNKHQYWIQTWHGSLGLKRLEGAGGDDRFYNTMQRLQTAQTDFLISNSEFENGVFSSTYWPDVPILQLGHARNDILFDQTKSTETYIRRKVLSRLGIVDSGQKFLLFAPTHDDKNLEQAFGNIDFDKLRDTLSQRFGGEWDILIRTHNTNKRRSNKWLAGLPIFCHNASFYPDMQELLVLSDVGLTDYSSWICDYILTKKPGFLYGANVKAYNQKRGFYHNIDDTPFTMATNNKELIENIVNFDQHEYEERIDQFLETCGSIDDGHASEKIVDKIEELMSS